MTYLDSHGRTLQDYPRPSVAVDTAVLTVTGDGLAVLLVDSGGQARLPGTFLHPGETLRDAALRALRDKAGVTGADPRQLHVFDAPTRDDRGWVLSVAHVDVVADLPGAVPVSALPPLKYDHDAIVAVAVAWLRSAYEGSPDAAGLLDPPFTLRRLRALHEAVAGRRLLPDAFRRAMLPSLVPVGSTAKGERGRPAALYRRAAGDGF